MKQDEIRTRPPKEVMAALVKRAKKKGVSIHSLSREILIEDFNNSKLKP